MNCTSCGEENRENAKFCAECGTPISRACAKCDHPLSATAKFCDECGTPVGDTTAPPETDDGAVRRTVTIVFADLVGSTAFGEAVDAETARREMGAYHELTRHVVESFGGELIKFIGDGVMAGFGITEVAEDDADRAVRAGIELQRRFEEIVVGIRTRHGAEVGLRVGINTGEVVIADADADMVGDPINTAARIEAQCTPGRVLVGEQTWRLTRSSVDYEVLGEVEVKGKTEPIATFQVLAAVEDEEVATPFVGREEELATLTAALENTIAEGAPQLVSVIGSPGVGKTRLAAELAGRAAEVTSFDLRVDRAGAATFEPIADLLRAVSDLPAGLDADATTDHLRTFVGDAIDADRLVPLLAGFVGAAPLRSTEESFWAARRLVEIVVAARPAVIVVDDIQWAEPLFLDLLEHLVEWTEGAAFVVALARPEIRDIRPAFAEVGRRVTEVIALEGLDPTTMAELATGILGGKALPAELIARLPDSTEGNPLFVRELVRMLVDDEVIAESPSGWVLAIDADAVDVPPTIISLLASRVERMDDEERRVVEAAAVVGSEFARGAVGTLLPNLGAAQLDRILERLRRQEIVDPTGSYWGDEPVWRFHHVLIRDAAYRRLLKERRIDMHRRVGQWTETTAAALGGDHEISIAFHYEQAHGYLRELGTIDGDTGELGGRAADLLALAAERALARDDLASAGSLATRALALLDEADARRGELLLAACEAWFGAGRVRNGAPHLDELRRHTGDERIAAWTAAFEGQYVVLTEPDRLNEIEPSVAHAATRLAEVGDDAGVAKARLVRALILARTGRVGECEDELDAALAAARAADDRRRITAVLGAAPVAALWGPSPVARAGGRCLDIIRLLRITSASPMVEAVSIRCQAVLEAMRGRFDEARTLIGRSQAIVEELGLRHGILECRMFAGYIELLADEPAAAEPHLRVAHAGLGTLGVGADAGQAAALLSRSLLLQGQSDEAAQLADESARLAGQNLQTGIASRIAQAEIAAHQGRLDDALQLAREAVALGAETDLTMDHATALMTLAAVQHRRDDDRAADDSTRAAGRLFGDKGAVATDTPTPRRFDFRSEAHDTAATRYARASSIALYDRRDVDAWEALCRPDGVFIDRRSLHDDVTDLAGRRALQLDIIHNLSSYDTELVAMRGERLCVFRNTVRFDDDRSEISILNVLEVDDDGLLIASVIFDPDDHVRAINELTQRFVAGEGAEFAHVIDAVRNHTVASFEDADAFAASMTDDYRFVDHRALLQSVTDRDASWDAVDIDLRQLFLQRIDRLTDRGLVGHCSSKSAEHAIEAEWDWILVQHVRNGQLWLTEIYDLDELDLALDRFDSMPVVDILDNEASRVSRRFWSRLYDDLDVDGAMELLTGGASDARSLQLPEWSPATVRQMLEESVSGVDRVEHEFSPVALRGDHHIAAHVRAVYHPSQAEREIYTAGRLDEGKLVDIQIFDNVDDTYAALEASFREHEGAEFAEVLDSVSAQCRCLAELDVDRVWDLADRDCMVVDHRPLISHETLLADMLDAHVETGMHGRMIVQRFARLTEHGAVQIDHSDFRDKNGIPVEFRSCQLRIIRDGKCAHFEIFPEHDVDAACARFDELTAESPLTNRAFEVSREFFRRLFDDSDVESAMALVHPEWANSDERGLHIGDLDTTSAHEWFSIGERPDQWSATAVAIRGDRVALSEMAVNVAYQRRFLLVSEIDESGLATRDAQFDVADLRDALDLLNEWYLAGEGAAHRELYELAWALGKAQESDSTEQAASLAMLMHDDVQMEDHRRFSFPAIDRAALVDDRRDVLFAPVGVIVPEYLAANPRGLLIVQENHESTDTGGQVVHRHLTLLIARDGKAARIEWYDEDDLDAALARFDELTASPRNGNRASATADLWIDHLNRGDVAAAFATRSDDWRVSDHRRSQLGNEVDTEVSRQWFADILTQGTHRWANTVIAVRGERVSLCLLEHPGEGPDERAYLSVGEVDTAGRGTRDALFETTDLRPALDLLNEWYLEGEGEPYRDIVELSRALGAAMEQDLDGQRAALLELMHPDVEMHDHRSFGAPTLTPDHVRAGEGGILDLKDVVLVSEYLAINELAMLGVADMRHTNEVGGPTVSRSLSLTVRRGDRASHLEWYDEDDLEGALARFHELTAEQKPPADTTWITTAERIADEMFTAFMNGDIDAFASHLADDFEADSARGLISGPMTREFFLDALASYGGFYPSGDEGTIATRGDRYAVTTVTQRTDDGFETQVLLALEFDDGHELRRLTSFDADDRDAAVALLEAWHLAGLDEEQTQALEVAFHMTNRSGAAGVLAPDFVSIDHRSIVAGSTSRDSFLHAMFSDFDGNDIPDLRHTFHHMPRLTKNGIVAVYTQESARSGVAADAASLVLVDGDAITRAEWFDADAVADACARFDELTDASGPLGSKSGLGLRVEAVLSDVVEATNRDDWDTARASLAPDFSFVSHRGLTGPGSMPLSGDEFIAQNRSFGQQGMGITVDIVATRGDHLALARFTMDQRGFEIAMYTLFEIDPQGRFSRAAAFADDDLASAQAELQEWWLESLEADAVSALALVTEWPRASADADGDRLRSILSEEMVAIDHRPVSWRSGDRQWFIDVQMEFYADPLEISVLHAPITTPTGGVVAVRVSTLDGSQEWHDATVFVVDRGQISRLEFHPGDRLVDAVARFEEITTSPANGNRASEVDVAVSAAVRHRDMEALAALMAADAVFVDHRKLTPRPADTIEGIVESVHAYTDQSMTHDRSLVAGYGEKVAFVEVTITAESGFDVQLFTVTEVDDDGRVRRFETFDGDDFALAQRCAYERWVEAEAPGARAALDPLQDISDAFGANDFEAISALLAPDFRHTVTKPLTAEGEFDAAGFLENMRIWVEMSGSIRNVTREIVDWNQHGAVLVSEISATDATGMMTEWASAHVFVVDDGKISVWEEFESHAVEAAVTRFEELTAGPETGPRIGNRASDIYLEACTYRYEHGDSAPLDRLTGSCLTDDRRAAGGGQRAPALGREHDRHHAEILMWQWDDVAVLRHTFTTADGVPTDASHIAVIRLGDDGTLATHVLFDPTDTDAAKVEFGVQFRPKLSPSHVAMVDQLTPYATGWATRDPEQLQRSLASDFVFADRIDHLDFTAEEYATSTEVNQEVVGDQRIWTTTFHVIADAGMVLTGQVETGDATSFDATWRFVLLHLWDGERFTRTEMYAAEQLAHVLTRFQELTADET